VFENGLVYSFFFFGVLGALLSASKGANSFKRDIRILRLGAAWRKEGGPKEGGQKQKAYE
jgi:hypothetical protein